MSEQRVRAGLVVATECDASQPLVCLIASQRLLTVWSEHASRAANILALGDQDLPHVVEVIRAKQPHEVVLEEALAGSPRGAPLMTELRQETRLRNLMIRLLSPERVGALLSSHPGYTSPQIWLTAFARPLAPRPFQRARRVPATPDSEILIDGHVGTLIDLSHLGAQVRSAQALQPNNSARITLAVRSKEISTTARVVWSVFELTPAPSYRAGLEFSQPVSHYVQLTTT